MTVLRAIVQAPVLPMFDTRHDLSFGRTVAGQFVCDHHAWSGALLLEQLSQQTLGGIFVTAALNQDIEHDSMLVDRTPEPMFLAGDADHDFIEMPFVSGCRTTADLVSKILTELQRLLPHGLITDLDTSGRQHLLDHAQAKREPEVQPNGVADHLSRKAVAGVARGTDRFHPSWIARSRSPSG